MTIPALLVPYTSQLETMTGMPTPQLLAIAVGAFEIISGLMIALNFGARFFAILLIFFVAGATFYFHDFWNQPSPDNARCDEMPLQGRDCDEQRGRKGCLQQRWHRHNADAEQH